MDLDKLQLALQPPRHLSLRSAWVQHIPFALALVDWLRPRTIVELGTYMGDSVLHFCQAVYTLDLPTRCTAIDTWTGDAQTGSYGPEILENLRAYHDPLYGRFSNLLQSTFDAAAPQFPNASIDLLHIDGLHTYDAVRHDFDTWLPKISSRGIVLLHDTQVKQGGFGVFRLWEELAGRYPSFEFTHGHGLGMLALGGELPPDVEALPRVGAPFAPPLPRILFSLGCPHRTRPRHFAPGRRLSPKSCPRAPVRSAQSQPDESRAVAAGYNPNLFDAGTELLSWLDRHCHSLIRNDERTQRLEDECLSAQAQLASAQHELAALREQLSLLTANAPPPPARAAASIYWPDAQGQFSQEHVQTAYLPVNGQPHALSFRLDLPAPAQSENSHGHRLRFDPGDHPAIWLIERLSLRLLHPRSREPIALPPRLLRAGTGVTLQAPRHSLTPPPQLTTFSCAIPWIRKWSCTSARWFPPARCRWNYRWNAASGTALVPMPVGLLPLHRTSPARSPMPLPAAALPASHSRAAGTDPAALFGA